MLVHDQHAVLDGVEERFQETPLARQPLDDGLQTFGVEPSNAAQDFVEETGFGRGQVSGARCQVSGVRDQVRGVRVRSQARRMRLFLNPPIRAFVLRACS